jgi:hypothetical protein
VSISNRHQANASVYDIDERLGRELRSCLKAMLEDDEEKLRKLKDVKTLINFYKEARKYKQQVAEEGVLSPIVNKIIEQLVAQVKSQYIGSIVENIEIQTRIKREEGTVELNSKVDLKALLKPSLEFIIEINEKDSYSIRFTFEIKTKGYVRKLTFTKNPEKGKSIHIEKLGMEIELSLLQIKFSDLLTLSSDISFNKKMKLGSKRFEIQNVSLYLKRTVVNKQENVCSKCDTVNSYGARFCANCSLSL